jgi:hypothetical protein
MHRSHWLFAGATAAAIAGSLSFGRTAPAAPTPPPVAAGHYVLVVEGDRDALAITAASRKAEPWAGPAKGLASAWSLTIHDARGELLATVPLDVSPFATDGQRGVRVEGCVVRDSRIGMLVNAPAFAAAATYTFTRHENGRTVALGTTAAEVVQQLAGERR